MIPKIIYQCGPWKQKEIPNYVTEYSSTWKNFSQDWQYRYFDDEMCCEDIKQIAGANMASTYKKIKRGDNRADLWRCIHIFGEGGFYADMDSKRFKTINNAHCETKKFICFRNEYSDIGGIWENWFFGAEKNSKILEKVIEEIQKEIFLCDGDINAKQTFFPFSRVVNSFRNEEWFFDMTDSFRETVGHISAHDNWGNVNYFANGGPCNV